MKFSNEEAKSDVQSQPSVSSAAEGPPDLIDVFKSHVDRSMDNCVGKSPMYVEGSGKTHTLKEQLIRAQVNTTITRCTGCGRSS